MRRSRRYDKGVYRSLAVVTQFSIHMLVPICMMTALGIYLDRRLDTSFLMILFFFIGAIAGGQNVYRLARRIASMPGEGRKKPGTEKVNGRKAAGGQDSGTEAGAGDVRAERKPDKLNESIGAAEKKK